MKTNIFHNASIRLTTLYLLIIMTISLLFSLSLYQVASNEIERGFRGRPGPISQMIRTRNVDLVEGLISEQEETIVELKSSLKSNLVILNILIAVVGGLLSYFLARKTLRPIETAHNAQNRFTADASHELRTPITAMRTETEITLTEPNLTLKDAKAQLNSNIEELDKLTKLSEDLLKLARLDNVETTRMPTDISEIINLAIERVKPLAEKNKQLFKLRVIPKIEVSADSASLTEAFVTLLDNAVKYSPSKSEIEVIVTKNKNTVEVKIIDNGDGIMPTDLPHIFERFYRAELSRTKNNVNGFGIGLAIAKETVESHGGTISAVNNKKTGATFTVLLPVLKG
ncbi:HAMP domain-containing histidine kinase [Candidatus Saccharibacteria bacterium]|nr:HAMP domain-containing histidine kinase [Candidatus Saccharibacteria bacterium]